KVYCARRQEHKARPVAATYGKLLDLCRFNLAAHLGRCAVYGFESCGHLNGIARRTHLERGVESSALRDHKRDIFELRGTEALLGNRHIVRSDEQERNLIGARRACGRVTPEARGVRYDRYCRADEYSSRRVFNRAIERSPISLGEYVKSA